MWCWHAFKQTPCTTTACLLSQLCFFTHTLSFHSCIFSLPTLYFHRCIFTTPPLFSQLCFQRAAWETPYQLVGHLGPVVCARFSPRLYYARKADGSTDRDEAGSCVALGGTDGVVSVWLLNNTRAVMAGRKV